MVTPKKKPQAFPRKRGAEVKPQRIRSQSHKDALGAVEWLNESKGTAAYKRVLGIRQELEKLTKMRNGSKLRAEEMVAFTERCNALNELLARYMHVQTIGYSTLSADWSLQMVPKPTKTKRDNLTLTVAEGLVLALGHGAGPDLEISGESITFPITEAWVVAALGRLANQRELFRVRLCDQCGQRWRVSMREMDRFCSNKCRDAFHFTSDLGKARNAARQATFRLNNPRPPSRRRNRIS